MYSTSQKNYIQEGANQEGLLKTQLKEQLGIVKVGVQSKRHIAISGPPGIGKSYTTMDTLRSSNLNWIQFGAGESDPTIAMRLAYAVYHLKPNEEVIALFDDADDAIFNDYETINKFKFALAKDSPFFNQGVNMENQKAKYQKNGEFQKVQIIDHFSVPGSPGMQIPTDQVRFVIICNRNFDNPKEFSKRNYAGVQAIQDRVKYTRLDFDWKVCWGWLAHILENSQPFENFPLTEEQKFRITDWMYSNWDQMRNPSYRTVEEMAEYIINHPFNYLDIWNARFLKRPK